MCDFLLPPLKIMRVPPTLLLRHIQFLFSSTSRFPCAVLLLTFTGRSAKGLCCFQVATPSTGCWLADKWQGGSNKETWLYLLGKKINEIYSRMSWEIGKRTEKMKCLPILKTHGHLKNKPLIIIITETQNTQPCVRHHMKHFCHHLIESSKPP